MCYIILILCVFLHFPELISSGQELRIAWMAPAKEYHGISASTSVGALKLALRVIKDHGGDTVQLSNYTIK